MTLLDTFNGFCDFGIASGLLMFVGLSVVTFCIWTGGKK